MKNRQNKSDNPLVSVIVPTYNSAVYLDGCLKSIENQSYKNIELIVVDNNSMDHTKSIAERYTRSVYNYGPERSAQRNYGVKKSSGRYFLVIDSDMHLSKNVISSCVEEIQRYHQLKALVIPEESFGKGFWSQCKKLERSFYVGVSWMEAARFFHYLVFTEFGGYNEKNTGTEDYDLPQRIEEKYGVEVVGRIDQFIYHNEQEISLWKTCKKKFYYAQRLKSYYTVEANVKNFKKQSNIFQRYLLFFSKPTKLLKNPIIGLGMLFMKTCEFTAGGIGYLVFKFKD